MSHYLRAVWIVYFCIFFCSYNASVSFAEPAAIDATAAEADSTVEESKKLLQKSLTIFEIDQEVARLSDKETAMGVQINSTLQKLDIQESLVEKTRKRAGQVLNAYYTGDRDTIWLLLFSAQSLSDAVSLLEYIHMIADQDYKSIQRYLHTYRDLKNLHASLVQIQTELSKLKQEFLVQRERAVTLQQELDKQLENNPEAAKLEQQMKQLIILWETKGIDFLKRYFNALAKAMKDLPDMVANHKDSLTMNGLEYSFQITDEQLKQFLLTKDPLFERFSFNFESDVIVAEGQEDDIDLVIKGHYILEETPKNAIRFLIDDMIFNGFTLPDTTRASLQERFELAFYPQMLASFLLATGVALEPGWLKVKLKMNLLE